MTACEAVTWKLEKNSESYSVQTVQLQSSYSAVKYKAYSYTYRPTVSL